MIYCEKGILTNGATSPTNPDKIAVEFTANDDYDYIWIFPKHNFRNEQPWVYIVEPRLAARDEEIASGGVTVFNKDIPYADHPSYGNYVVALLEGPRYFDATYKWYDINNNLLAERAEGKTYNLFCPLNQTQVPMFCFWMHIINFGPSSLPSGLKYKYHMSFPTSINTNNTCSIPFADNPTIVEVSRLPNDGKKIESLKVTEEEYSNN